MTIEEHRKDMRYMTILGVLGITLMGSALVLGELEANGWTWIWPTSDTLRFDAKMMSVVLMAAGWALGLMTCVHGLVHQEPTFNSSKWDWRCPHARTVTIWGTVGIIGFIGLLVL